MAVGPWIGAALSGLGLLGGLFGKKKQVSDSSYSNTSMPNYDPTNLGFRDFLINSFKNRASGEGDAAFEHAYKLNGLKAIGRTNATAGTAIDDILSSRGLGMTTAGAGTLRDTALSNATRTGDFLTSMPLIMDQRRQSNLRDAAAYQSGLPVGTTTSGTSHTEGEGGPSSPAAGGIFGGTSAFAGYLGQLYAQQQFQDVLKSLGSGTNMKITSPGHD